jgi:lactate dehydrogenase-like 2-hydroxyacid dehydrogenase
LNRRVALIILARPQEEGTMSDSILVLAPMPASALDPLRERLTLVDASRDPLAFLQAYKQRDSAEIVFTIGNRPLTRDMIGLLPALRYVCHFGVGTDQLDLDALRRRGVLITNTLGASASCVADLAVAMLLSLVKSLPQADAFVRRGAWGRERKTFDVSAGGRKVGIYGLGEIGQRIATRLAAFEMEIGYFSSFRPQAPYAHFPSLLALADWADDLVVAVSANADTDGSVNGDVLAALGPRGNLVNVARGSIVDEDALIEALRTGAIAGAGLDTFRDEPRIRAEFLTLENVILSPHAGGGTERGIRNAAAIFHANLERYLAGEPPQNVVR